LSQDTVKKSFFLSNLIIYMDLAYYIFY
jgi:hypothetical protein